MANFHWKSYIIRISPSETFKVHLSLKYNDDKPRVRKVNRQMCNLRYGFSEIRVLFGSKVPFRVNVLTMARKQTFNCGISDLISKKFGKFEVLKTMERKFFKNSNFSNFLGI